MMVNLIKIRFNKQLRMRAATYYVTGIFNSLDKAIEDVHSLE